MAGEARAVPARKLTRGATANGRARSFRIEVALGCPSLVPARKTPDCGKGRGWPTSLRGPAHRGPRAGPGPQGRGQGTYSWGNTPRACDTGRCPASARTTCRPQVAGWPRAAPRRRENGGRRGRRRKRGCSMAEIGRRPCRAACSLHQLERPGRHAQVEAACWSRSRPVSTRSAGVSPARGRAVVRRRLVTSAQGARSRGAAEEDEATSVVVIPPRNAQGRPGLIDPLLGTSGSTTSRSRAASTGPLPVGLVLDDGAHRRNLGRHRWLLDGDDVLLQLECSNDLDGGPVNPGGLLVESRPAPMNGSSPGSRPPR